MSDEFDVSPRATKRRKIVAQPQKENVQSSRVEEDTVGYDSEDDPNFVQPSNDREEECVPKLRSSGRQRTKTQKFEGETSNQTTPSRRARDTRHKSAASQTYEVSPLKGILTPSKDRKSKSRKAVAFDRGKGIQAEDLGFRDIDASTTTPTRSTKRHLPSSRELSPDEHEYIIDPFSTSAISLIQEDDFFDHSFDGTPQLTAQIDEQESAIYNLAHKDDDLLVALKSTILSRLASSCPSRTTIPSHLSKPYTALHSLLTATVASSESNSLLLLGPRGSGKTLLVEHALRDLASTHGEDGFYTVRLNGFLQTDDRLALREIWRQLGRELAVEEDEMDEVAGSYADTMTSLLNLLSHPDEMNFEDDNTTSNTQDRLGSTFKSTIFILDEFDLFTTHPRQTLLYNLFDIAQSKKAPIAVIGCSNRMDVIDGLEKRVKSRFSQRWVFVPPAKSLVEWDAIIRNLLCLNTSDEGYDENGTLLNVTSTNRDSIQRWDETIKDKVIATKDFQAQLRRHFYTTKSLPDFFVSLYPIIGTLQPSTSMSDVDPIASDLSSPSLLQALINLPTLHLALLVSHCRLEAIHTLPSTNFNLTYTHYTELIKRSRLQKTAGGAVAVSGSLREWMRDTCRVAWEELGFQGFMVPAVGGEGGGGEFEDSRMWKSEVSLDEVEWSIREKFKAGSVGAVDELLKWCKEV